MPPSALYDSSPPRCRSPWRQHPYSPPPGSTRGGWWGGGEAAKGVTGRPYRRRKEGIPRVHGRRPGDFDPLLPPSTLALRAPRVRWVILQGPAAGMVAVAGLPLPRGRVFEPDSLEEWLAILKEREILAKTRTNERTDARFRIAASWRNRLSRRRTKEKWTEKWRERGGVSEKRFERDGGKGETGPTGRYGERVGDTEQEGSARVEGRERKAREREGFWAEGAKGRGKERSAREMERDGERESERGGVGANERARKGEQSLSPRWTTRIHPHEAAVSRAGVAPIVGTIRGRLEGLLTRIPRSTGLVANLAVLVEPNGGCHYHRLPPWDSRCFLSGLSTPTPTNIKKGRRNMGYVIRTKCIRLVPITTPRGSAGLRYRTRCTRSLEAGAEGTRTPLGSKSLTATRNLSIFPETFGSWRASSWLVPLSDSVADCARTITAGEIKAGRMGKAGGVGATSNAN
ncbi:hypothetical protein KM043_008105 [Ampulex compressa]|nr:hypothetical protein KM043_008105 [Ampulex compressa]